RGGNGPFTASKRAAYFFAYGPLVKLDVQGRPSKDAGGHFTDDGQLAYSLQATFDGRDPQTNLPAKHYVIPDACVQCHGGSQAQGKLNLPETGPRVDRVLPDYGVAADLYKQEDFVALAQAPFPVLYDGGKDPAAVPFKTALETIRQLNAEIKSQNERAGGS